MTQKIFVVLAVLVGNAVFAATADDAQFSYTAANAAFQTAQPPTGELLTGEWVTTGIASAPEVDSSSDGYWPDGKFQIPGQSGYFRRIQTVTSGTDSLGNTIYDTVHRSVGFESGKTYSTTGPFTGVISATGYVFDCPGTDSTCAERYECRLVAGRNILLCNLINLDQRRACLSIAGDGVSSGQYISMIKLAK